MTNRSLALVGTLVFLAAITAWSSPRREQQGAQHGHQNTIRVGEINGSL